MGEGVWSWTPGGRGGWDVPEIFVNALDGPILGSLRWTGWVGGPHPPGSYKYPEAFFNNQPPEKMTLLCCLFGGGSVAEQSFKLSFFLMGVVFRSAGELLVKSCPGV